MSDRNLPLGFKHLAGAHIKDLADKVDRLREAERRKYASQEYVIPREGEYQNIKRREEWQRQRKIK